MRTLILGRRQGSTISVILLERVGTVGQTGNIVDVKRGYARNFLIPRKLAAYATTENKTKFANIIQNSASAKPETASA
jgi:large subunit ribosomal protein L9